MKNPLFLDPYLGFSDFDQAEFDVLLLARKWGVLRQWLYGAIKSGALKANKTRRPMLVSREEAVRFQTEHILPMLGTNTFIRDTMNDFIGSRRTSAELEAIKDKLVVKGA